MERETVNQRTLRRLRKFAEDIERGDLGGYRATKVILNEDGTMRRVIGPVTLTTCVPGRE